MTPPDLPPRLSDEPPPEDALDAALREQTLLPAPPDLVGRITAGLPRRGRVLSLPALARLAAAVLLALGTWVAAIGGMPSLARAETPPLVEEVLAPTHDLLPRTASDIPVLGTAEEEVPPAALAGVGIALLAAGLLLARRAYARTPAPTHTSPTPDTENPS